MQAVGNAHFHFDVDITVGRHAIRVNPELAFLADLAGASHQSHADEVAEGVNICNRSVFDLDLTAT